MADVYLKDLLIDQASVVNWLTARLLEAAPGPKKAALQSALNGAQTALRAMQKVEILQGIEREEEFITKRTAERDALRAKLQAMP